VSLRLTCTPAHTVRPRSLCASQPYVCLSTATIAPPHSPQVSSPPNKVLGDASLGFAAAGEARGVHARAHAAAELVVDDAHVRRRRPSIHPSADRCADHFERDARGPAGHEDRRRRLKPHCRGHLSHTPLPCRRSRI